MDDLAITFFNIDALRFSGKLAGGFHRPRGRRAENRGAVAVTWPIPAARRWARGPQLRHPWGNSSSSTVLDREPDTAEHDSDAVHGHTSAPDPGTPVCPTSRPTRIPGGARASSRGPPPRVTSSSAAPVTPHAPGPSSEPDRRHPSAGPALIHPGRPPGAVGNHSRINRTARPAYNPRRRCSQRPFVAACKLTGLR